VHWNFFFSLGRFPIRIQIISSYARLAILLGVAYQSALEFTSLKAYILTAPRTNLLSQNREGVFSFFGT
jgi:phosphatidylinositol glycan class W